MANKRLRSYYPESSIEKGLLTNGKELMTTEYSEYIGYYHRYTNGEVFSLYDYNDRLSVKLIPYDEIIIRQNIKYNNFSKLSTFNPKRYTSPVAKIISPELSDFKSGDSWTRYFIRKVNDKNWGILELDRKQYENTQTLNKNSIDSFLYKLVEIQWKLTGNMYDTYNDKTLIPGVYDTNMRTITKHNETFRGLSEYLTDPLEYTVYSKWYEVFISNKIKNN